MDFLDSTDHVGPEKGSDSSKGGRKPIYATTEERKQRNRQAQAAFRERRTEHIKELEELVREQKSDFLRLQAAHTQATDECLMLRYKNSLLERILLEKGVDVQAELYAKRDTSYLDPIQGVTTYRRPPDRPSPPKVALQPLKINPRKRKHVENNVDSLPPLATSPHSSISENNLIPTPPASTPIADLRPTVIAPSPNAVSPPPDTAEEAAANILKRLKGNQTGSMRDTAAYFLSSFLQHIENLEKETPPTTQNVAQPSSSLPPPSKISHIQSESHAFEPLDCHLEMNETTSQLSRKVPVPVSVSEIQPESTSVFASSNFYEQMLYADPFGLDSSLQFPVSNF